MAIHSLDATRETLHGTFSREREPVLTIDPGDVVRFRTLDAGWTITPPDKNGEGWERFEPRDEVLDEGHALTGPVAINGAEPGMTLAVHINQLQTGSWGWNRVGGHYRPLNVQLGVADSELTLRWDIDTKAMRATNQFEHTVGLRPFLGVMGVAPSEPGHHQTGPPRTVGGNIDCKELIAGTTLYLPVAVSGALFSPGDGHAVQGDGEVSGSAIECAMELAELSFDVRDDMPIATPRALTADAWLTFGFDEDLNQARYIALDAMLDLMADLYGVDRELAMGLASLVVDLRITQVVNGAQGVHAVLPHGAIG